MPLSKIFKLGFILLFFFNIQLFAHNFISEKEKKYARQIKQALYASSQLNQDPEINYYINQIIQRLLSGIQSKKKMHLYLINEDQKNAAAWPGGYITIYKGLISLFQSEDEFASVVAHEMAHVIKGHIEQLFNQSFLSSEVIVGTLLGLLTGGVTVAAATTIGISKLQQTAFSRSKEKEADSEALTILNQANYSLKSMSIFFQRMLSQTTNEKLIPYFQTHPLLSFRLSNALEYSKKIKPEPSLLSKIQSKFSYKLKLKAKYATKNFLSLKNTINYGFLMLKTKAQTTDKLQAFDQDHIYQRLLIKNLKKQTIDQNEINILLKENNNNPYVLNLLANIYFEQKQYQKALQFASEANKIWNDFYPAILTMAKIYHAIKNTQKAIELINSYLKNYQNNWLIQTQLTSYHFQASDQITYWKAKTKEYVLKGEIEKAITLLENGKNIMTHQKKTQNIEKLNQLIKEISKLKPNY